MSPRGGRGVLALSSSLVSVALLLSLLLAWGGGVGLEAAPSRADCAVVLGAAVWTGGVPSPVLARRAHQAAELWRQGRVRGVLCTGGVGRTPPSEGESARRYLMEVEGLPAEVLEVEGRSHTTHDNLRFAQPLLQRRGWSTVLVVTDGYHLARSVAIARDLGLRAWGVADDGGVAASLQHNPRRRWSEAWLLLLHALARVLV